MSLLLKFYLFTTNFYENGVILTIFCQKRRECYINVIMMSFMPWELNFKLLSFKRHLLFFFYTSWLVGWMLFYVTSANLSIIKRFFHINLKDKSKHKFMLNVSLCNVFYLYFMDAKCARMLQVNITNPPVHYTGSRPTSKGK